jgi:hypothetical protein
MAAACSASSDTLGEALQDAGRWLHDAADTLVDAGRAADDSAVAQTPPEPEASNGSRLRARYISRMTVGADGAAMPTTRSFLGWFDTERNEACAVTTAPDGKTRCMPNTVATSGRYSDSACATAAALVAQQNSCVTLPVTTTPKYALETVKDVSGCTRQRISPLGAKLATASHYSKDANTGKCIGPFTITGQDLYDASGPEIAPTEFVEFTVTTTIE